MKQTPQSPGAGTIPERVGRLREVLAKPRSTQGDTTVLLSPSVRESALLNTAFDNSWDKFMDSNF